MTLEHFEESLRDCIRREPFQPFVVEMEDGRVIEVVQPSVAFDAGAASYIRPTTKSWSLFAKT